MELIQLKGVRKVFNQGAVLDDVNITLEEGDILGVIGRSGSGKSTLLNLMTGFLAPTQGQTLYYSKVTHEPRDLNANLHRIKKFIGFAPQRNSFYSKLTIKENLLYFGTLYGMPHDVLVENIKSLLQFMSLWDDRNKLAEELSGGMQKRLDISCSLVHKPKLLVLDEPTADLDPLLQKEISILLQEVHRQGVTIVIASHNLESIENLCNKVVIINKGRVHSFGLLDDVKKPYIKDYFTINLNPGESKEKIIASLKKLPIKKIVDQDNKLIIFPADTEKTVKGLLTVIAEEHLGLHDVDVRKPTLNEIFQQIAQEK